MFVLSVKSEKLRIFSLIVLAVLAGVGISLLTKGESTVSDMNGIVLKAGNAEERVAFLSQFGWEVSEEPLEVAEVMIPSEFDDTYILYNEMQTEQGFNLEKYKGVRAKRWTYEIRNYPGYPEDSGCIRANILVYEGNVIGGDVCSVELDGFMHGFENPSTGTTTTAPTTSTTAKAETTKGTTEKAVSTTSKS